MANGILGIVPIAQSLALAGENVAFAKDTDKNTLDFVRQGVENVVGINLMGATSNAIGSF